MNKRYFCVLACLMCIAGCGDDSDSGKSKGCDPLCGADETCVEGTCKKMQELKACDPLCGSDETCVDGTCKKTTELKACEPACEDGQTCVDGRCAICIGTECFYAGGDDDEDCQSDSDCEDGQYCLDGECRKRDIACEPACGEKEKCVEGKCVSNSFLWSLCNNQADCASGSCVYFLTPSRELVMDVNGETKVFNSDNPISVSYLDDRINAENYNAMHPSSSISATVSVGICSYECTKEGEKTCPDGWSCQIVAKGKSLYPENATLPVLLSESELNKTPFAAVCRPDISTETADNTSLSSALCSKSKDECEKAGLVYYHGMCLDKCDTRDTCPLMFGCESVDVDGSETKVCLPVAGSCTGCYDNDGDGAGYGHCTLTGVDCDDNNPNAYYTKELSCKDLVGDDGNSINGDLNCNGIIDRFEMAGTVNNCTGCGVSCKKPQTDSISVTCEAKSQELSSDWRLSATGDMALPEFECVEQCAFGYGDCSGNAKCTTELLKASARSAFESGDVHIAASMVNADKGAAIYAKDADDDGYPMIDRILSVSSVESGNPEIILDVDRTLICCGDNTKYCYTANAAWKTTNLDSVKEEVEDENGEKREIQYVDPKGNESCANVADLDCYDSDDTDKTINPAAIERCDDVDNDGSRILLNETAEDCETWCADGNNDCSSFSSVKDGKTVYRTNAYCDATPEGSEETEPWQDVLASNHDFFYGQACAKRNEGGDVCNENGIVTCEAAPFNRCGAGSRNCSCGTANDGYAYIISENNTIVDESGNVTADPNDSDYVKLSDSNYNVIKCRCDDSLCTGDNCEGQDGKGCFELCGKLCHFKVEYALSCTAVSDGSKKDGLVDGKPEFNGIDENCNGAVDEDAWLPCVIGDNGKYESLKGGSQNYIAYTDDMASTYELPTNSDGSVNLCRLGMLQGVQKGNEYEGVCVPMYKPREYDFYGDGIDSNCDGADYDVKHAIFVEKDAQGTMQGDQNNTCRYGLVDGKYVVNPCSTLNGALAKAKDESNSFYHDILVTSNEYKVGMDGMAQQISPIHVPTLASTSMLQKYYELDTKGLSDIAGQIKSGHLISAYAVHSQLLARKRSKSTFDPNKYLFAYDRVIEVKDSAGNIKDYRYEKAEKSEISQPKETIRIYGGFTRGGVPYPILDAENDVWINSGGQNKTSYTWAVEPLKTNNTYRKVYSLVSPVKDSAGKTDGPLSILFSNFDLKIGVPSDPLPYELADGVTVIGIDGSSGAKDIVLSDSTLDVKAFNGYSFPTTSNASKGSDATENKEHANSNCWWDKESDYTEYVKKYESNRSDEIKYECGYEYTDSYMTRSLGGVGGYGKSTTWGHYEDYRAGRPSTASRSKDGSYTSGTSAGGKGHKYKDEGCDRNTDCDNLKNSDTHGASGSGGKNGRNGTGAEIKMSYSQTADGLWVKSDRSKARGRYGLPGIGGGGSGILRCWKGGGSDHAQCWGAYGGDGGCGGKGGEAGGIGGSAFGIVLRSIGTDAGSTRFDIKITGSDKTNDASTIVVTNGSGGLAQTGGAGGKGGDGGHPYLYAREGGANKDTQCHRMGAGGAGGGGGAGGVGAGGKAGWAYPILTICPFTGTKYDATNVDLATLDKCGFSFPADMLAKPEGFATQSLSGQSVSDTAQSSGSGVSGKMAKPLLRGGDSENTGCNFPYGGAGATKLTQNATKYVDYSCKKGGKEDGGSKIIEMITSDMISQ